MYSGVPYIFALAQPSASRRAAAPQSSTSTSPKSPSMMLSGLMSPCTMRRLCANEIAWPTAMKAVTMALNEASRPSRAPGAEAARMSPSGRPSTWLMVKNRRPSALRSRSCTGSTFGWRSTAVRRASSTKPCSASAAGPSAAPSSFTATSRSRLRSRAENTSPLPPAPSRPRTSKRSRWPGSLAAAASSVPGSPVGGCGAIRRGPARGLRGEPPRALGREVRIGDGAGQRRVFGWRPRRGPVRVHRQA